jgi:aromatic-L-amino-acid/L-tryptophan decarboxylase
VSEFKKDEQYTLDPENWNDIRSLGHKMLDDMIDYLMTIRDRPVWTPLSDDMKNSIAESLPKSSQNREQIYNEFKEKVLPYPPGNIHPRFWGWVNGTGSPFGMLAEMVAAAMNANTGGREHMPKYVENQVLEWAKELMGFPKQSSATLTDGCSTANLIALTVARNIKSDINMRKAGLVSFPKKLTFYTSVAMHSSIQKALEIIGIGADNLKQISVDKDYKIRLDLLEETIKNDIAQNCLPVCIIANVGTVNTGAVDDLLSIRRVCDNYNLWMHIDGAFGAIANLSTKYKHKVKGMNLADSLAFDFHKWLYVPYTAGCVIIKDEKMHLDSFSLRPEYLAQAERGLASGGRWPTEYGIQLSRPFYALKIWFMLKENGIEKYDKLVTQNIDQANYMLNLIEANSKLELVAPVYLNVVCFRYNPGIDDQDTLNRINNELLLRLHESGIAAPSSTNLNGSISLRLAITNHRSKYEDFDLLVETVTKIGDLFSNEIIGLNRRG